MCGLFGYFGSKPADLKQLKRTALSTEEARGGHAYGWAWINFRGRLRVYKAPGRLADHPEDMDMLAGSKALVGHLRFATHGSAHDNVNNHPHPSDGGWIVHNGIIRRHAWLSSMNCLERVTECDSEVLALLVEVSLEKTLSKRIADAASRCSEDGSPLAMLGIWKDPVRIAVCRAGNPLAMHLDGKGGMLLASLPAALPVGNTKEIKDDYVEVLRIGNRKVTAKAS